MQVTWYMLLSSSKLTVHDTVQLAHFDDVLWQAFERRVQECQRGLEQVEEDVEEEAEEGQWTEAQTNRPKLIQGCQIYG